MTPLVILFLVIKCMLFACECRTELIPDDVKDEIKKTMEHYHIPGFSIAVVQDGKIAWARGFGHLSTDPNGAFVDEHTLFQAASVSKAITAFGALILVQQGKISLDKDVNFYLKRWKIPENEFTKTEKVTLRMLLSHSAGIGAPGFPGYSPLGPIPTILDILEGKKANSAPITVIAKPGSEFKYSGGGTTIVQFLIEEITGETFENWMEKNVLKPLGMNESTFQQPLPPPAALHAAQGHHLNGAKVPGNWHYYPEKGAAGLWSTPIDLARFILYIQSALKKKESKPLHYDYVREMVTRQKAGEKECNSGLGLFIINRDSDLIFGHRGQNEGFIALLVGYAFHGQGAVMMMNTDSNWNFIEKIAKSISETCEWPHYQFIGNIDETCSGN